MSFAVHRFFQERRFHQVHTPIITSSDCEGAGEMFRVTNLDPSKPRTDSGKDFFGKPTYLTVSGQLEGEAFACALGRIYTFGPTFRAENSNTSRHAAEFWMIEPEMAFADLGDDMNLAEEMVKFLANEALENQEGDLKIFEQFVDKNLRKRLETIVAEPFVRVTYTEAIEALKKSGKRFQYSIDYGQNLQSEHERWLTEEHFKKPTIVFHYPKELKPFYMRLNDDQKTVAAMDVLVPGIGEIVGGSQREERLEILIQNLKKHDLSTSEYQWYLDTRRFGRFHMLGLGWVSSACLCLLTGVSNIRDVIPFARTPGHCEF